MFVMNASFEIDKEHEDRLAHKAKKNKQEILEADGVVSFECWRKEHRETVEYVFVSKWEKQEDFKAWISREEHVEEHKEMNKKKKVEEPAVKIKKTLRSFETLEID
ncbi:antibiotic biosynthesis monooxygenase family protein [Priestia filamentosa]|uniref:antibiotic biosynthesis monooxygenase family protein n=1 Tax=Priestia filamentosa TaxID=1402861 RepID=UPI000A08657C|nr:antibiotic biosynthesis monooxygenase [Priestia filamentosa]MDT3764768.1 antibiotic biosynthesis monooxygenase [Priestia filamentosa]OXS70789.1 antibiotic biosynthesis monooxygenase [Priestia filamentosa]WRU95099.1 antibiotic biosynthesis monooxygenase [Priestia filamentosa]SMF00363.1 Heme-degrading monooxygenase HmoA [Priestia filamentosa]